MAAPTDATATISDRAIATRKRILEAARAEFAQYGFGGGRIDRIAVGAGANKERIYAYFGDKRALFVATIASVITEVAETVGGDADGIVDFVERREIEIGSRQLDQANAVLGRKCGDQIAEIGLMQFGDLGAQERLVLRCNGGCDILDEFGPDLAIIRAHGCATEDRGIGTVGDVQLLIHDVPHEFDRLACNGSDLLRFVLSHDPIVALPNRSHRTQ